MEKLTLCSFFKFNLLYFNPCTYALGRGYLNQKLTYKYHESKEVKGINIYNDTEAEMVLS